LSNLNEVLEFALKWVILFLSRFTWIAYDETVRENGTTYISGMEKFECVTDSDRPVAINHLNVINLLCYSQLVSSRILGRLLFLYFHASDEGLLRHLWNSLIQCVD